MAVEGRSNDEDDWERIERLPPRGGLRLVHARPRMRFNVLSLDDDATVAVAVTI